MKAIVYEQYGSPDVLKLTEIKKPVPKAKEVLIKIHATSVNFGDLTARKFNEITPKKFSMPMPLWLPSRLAFGFNKPKKKILGSEFAGEVESVGKDVTKFKKGDQVYGFRSMNMGCYAEYLSVPEKSVIALKPSNMKFDEAAAIPYGALMALNLLKKAKIHEGQKVLIIGASGGIGSAALQLAKNYGAEVTGVCGTTSVDYVRSLGADKIIDYKKQDFTKDGEKYDLILDVLGKSSFTKCKNSLTRNGRYFRVSFKTKHLFQMLWTSIKGGKRVVCGLAIEKPEDLVFIRRMIEDGKLKVIIDKKFPLEQAAEAHRYVEDGKKKGSVVIAIR
ncbi:MAG: NAD(P)-dependent alcohol dehydrogenase [Acidobacteria bacterium]|nr:NAD(P)-dependent alcohol dehydrogenase [Acidobacteriota bacterium]